MTRRAARILPQDVNDAVLRLGAREVRVTNLKKVFWRDLGITKGALIEYYVSVADYLLPHLRDRATVMKRYPNGAAGDFFFMKRALFSFTSVAPSPRTASEISASGFSGVSSAVGWNWTNSMSASVTPLRCAIA